MYEIVAVRLKQADDARHEHVDLLGYHSTHLKTEPIMIPPKRILEKAVIGEKFFVTVNGEKADVVFGSCPVCGIAAYPRTSADTGEAEHLKELPQQ